VASAERNLLLEAIVLVDVMGAGLDRTGFVFDRHARL
jgi:hypothetical protein